MILECAELAGAQFIVTGDKDLLALHPYRGIRIVTPAEFLAGNA
jgi:predicted nucleic acid-binding protein